MKLSAQYLVLAYLFFSLFSGISFAKLIHSLSVRIPRKSYANALMDEKGIYTPLHNGKYDSDIKPTPFIDERASTSYLNVSRNSARPWRASFFNAPIIEILAVVSSLVFAGSSMCILLLSDGSPIHSWSLTPSVYLSIITAGTNNLLRFAFSKGVSISWWNQALHGTTLEDLHLTWKYGASFLSTLLPPFARHKFSIIRLTSFLLAVLVADGPLLQRSLSVAPTQMSSTSLKAFPVRLQPMVNLTSHLTTSAIKHWLPGYLSMNQSFSMHLVVCVQRNLLRFLLGYATELVPLQSQWPALIETVP